MIPRNYGVHMGDDFEFIDVVGRIAKEVDSIVETGTRHGNGSTLVLARTERPVHTIECNPAHYEQAVANLKQFPNVQCHLGYSLPLSRMLEFIDKDPIYDSNLTIMFDDPVNPREYYKIELGCHFIRERLLEILIDNSSRQLILLDSAGGVGWLEFCKVMELPQHRLQQKILLLDDIAHVKHYRSVKQLNRQFPDYFVRSKSGRWGWIDFAAAFQGLQHDSH